MWWRAFEVLWVTMLTFSSMMPSSECCASTTVPTSTNIFSSLSLSLPFFHGEKERIRGEKERREGKERRRGEKKRPDGFG